MMSYDPEKMVLGQWEELPYAADALEPIFDSETMKLHHEKHMRAYYDNAQKASIALHQAQALGNAQAVIDQTRIFINNAGGYFNHKLFFAQWKKGGVSLLAESHLAKALTSTWGSLEEFKGAFEAAGLSHFGSGWVWLVAHSQTKALSILTTANQDPPHGSFRALLGVDLWEHAYYLRYQNRRAEYLKNIWQILDWNVVSNRF